VTEYAWDHRNRLTGVTFKNNNGTVKKTIVYTYDAEGRRIKRAVDADGGMPNFTNEYFAYDGSNLAMRFGNAKELTHRHLYGPLLDQVVEDVVFTAGTGGQRVTDDVLWQLADQQGSIRDVVDLSGDQCRHVDYDSFGQITGEQ
jgi:YD repeat-containing protein